MMVILMKVERILGSYDKYHFIREEDLSMFNEDEIYRLNQDGYIPYQHRYGEMVIVPEEGYNLFYVDVDKYNEEESYKDFLEPFRRESRIQKLLEN